MNIQNLIVILPGADLKRVKEKTAQSSERETAVICFLACPELKAICRDRSFSYVSGGVLLDKAEKTYAAEYDSLISFIPDTHPELLQTRIWKEMPLWWAHELREKNTLVYPAMLRSFRVLAIRDWIRRHGPERIFVYTDVRASAAPLCFAYPEKKLMVYCADRFRQTRPRLLLSRMLNFRRYLTAVGQAKRFRYKRLSEADVDCLFLTPIRYLRQTGNDVVVDKYLLDTPERVARYWKTASCFTVFGNRLGISGEECRQACDFLAAEQEKIPLPFTLLESCLEKKDVFHSFWSLSTLMNEVRYGTGLGSVQLSGMDLSPIFRNELGRSIASAPCHRLAAVGLNRLLKKTQPKCVCSYSFEHGWGRLITYAVQQASIPFVGFQHGPWSRRYSLVRWSDRNVGLGMPIPDRMILDGEYPKGIFLENGISEERLAVAGACRYDPYDIAPEKANADQMILVAPSLYDTRDLAQYVHTSGLAEKYRVVCKPHPSSYSDMEALGSQFPGIEFRSGDIADMIRECSIMICTFSSVAFEAMMHGKKVISVLPEGAINMAPWEDHCEFSPVLRDSREMLTAVDRLLATERGNKKPQEGFLNDLLGPLDGRSCERAARILDETIRSRNER